LSQNGTRKRTFPRALNLKEDPSKNDIFFVKRGLSMELQESRDIAGHIQIMAGETTMAVQECNRSS
jgi:hypothetical protein